MPDAEPTPQPPAPTDYQRGFWDGQIVSTRACCLYLEHLAPVLAENVEALRRILEENATIGAPPTAAELARVAEFVAIVLGGSGGAAAQLRAGAHVASIGPGVAADREAREARLLAITDRHGGAWVVDRGAK